MSEQLHAMLDFSVRPNLVLRVVPLTADVSRGVDAHFQLCFAGLVNPVAFTESTLSRTFYEQREEIQLYRDHYDALASAALDPEQSRAVLIAAAQHFAELSP
jgi:hypothetical protein